MGKTGETLNWAWRNRRWTVPTAAVLGLTVWLGGPDLAAKVRATDSAAETVASTAHRTANHLGGLICESLKVKTVEDRQVLTATVSEALPEDAQVAFTYATDDGEKPHAGYGDRGALQVKIPGRHGAAHTIHAEITLDNASTPCPTWYAPTATAHAEQD